MARNSGGSYLPVKTGENGGTVQRSSSLRWTAVALLGVFSLLILLGISQRAEDINEYEKYHDGTVLDDISSLQQHMAPVVQGLHKIGAKNRAKKELAEKKKAKKAKKAKRDKHDENEVTPVDDEDIPDPVDLAGTKSVWDFLYQNADDELIHFTASEAEEDDLPEEELNIITYLIQAVERQRADEWLVQLALWFHTVAEEWPNDVRIPEDDDQIQIEELLSGPEFNNGKALDPVTAAELGDLLPEDTEDSTKTLEQLEEQGRRKAASLMQAMLDRGAIKGEVAIAEIKAAIAHKATLKEWRKTLNFLLSVAEAAPVFREYLEEWDETSFKDVSDVVFESSPTKKMEMMQTSARLLTTLERGCKAFPRTSSLIRSIFLQVLNEEGVAEGDVKALAVEP